MRIQRCNKRCMDWHKLPLVAVTVTKLYPTLFMCFILHFHMFTPVYSIHRCPGRRKMVSRGHIRNFQVSDLLHWQYYRRNPFLPHGSWQIAHSRDPTVSSYSIHEHEFHLQKNSTPCLCWAFFASWKCLSSSEAPRHTNLITAGSNMASEKHSSQ